MPNKIPLILIAIITLTTIQLFGQNTDSVKNNISGDSTIIQYVIEYDTIVTKPDTLKITDTIFNKIQEKKIKPINKTPYFVEFDFSPNFSNYINTYSTGKSGQQYYNNQPINYQYLINVGINYHNFLIKLGIGFFTVKERFYKNGAIISNDSTDNSDSTVYYQKTIIITTEGTNYFYYGGLSMTVGYEIHLKKINITPEIGLGYYSNFPSRPIYVDSTFNIKKLEKREYQ